jgi:nucleoside-diphosphate-sugar epimerase
MTGMKFGASGNAALTWAMNTYLPARVADRYKDSRIAAFSTGNVYGLVQTASGGSHEDDALRPVGEYAMSAVGRERMLEYMSGLHNIPMSIIRLNYACELRYGVLVDLARWVWEGKPISRAMGHFNVIWQRDANAFTLQSLEHATTPPFVLNVTGPEVISVEAAALRFGDLMGKAPVLTGEAGDECLLNDASRSFELFGTPTVSAERLMTWIAEWVMRGGDSLNKLTHFEVVNGQF